jgi:hypothetical protein
MLDVATIKRVSKREFQQSTGKWLKEAPVMITNRGVDEYLIQRASDVATKVATKTDSVHILDIKGEKGSSVWEKLSTFR